MALEGLHHITAITADAQRNVDFYVRLLGLRLVKKTVNFDAPDVYHLYYGDESGAPGSILTFFEFPGAARGHAGAGMVHTIQWRVAHEEAIDFWDSRLTGEGVEFERDETWLRFSDFEGLTHELLTVEVQDCPLVAEAPGVPPEYGLHGFHGIRAFAERPDDSVPLLESLGFRRSDEPDFLTWVIQGAHRHSLLTYDQAPEQRGRTAAGTIHHVAWSAADDAELISLRERAVRAGAHATEIIDRQYFHSVYFREPSGVLFELATRDIGFTYDEPLETLGEALKLPPQYEHMRADLERRLTPIADPRHQLTSG
jgi:glyoxalase family protein